MLSNVWNRYHQNGIRIYTDIQDIKTKDKEKYHLMQREINVYYTKNWVIGCNRFSQFFCVINCNILGLDI